jgi:hypothetical protein
LEEAFWGVNKLKTISQYPVIIINFFSMRRRTQNRNSTFRYQGRWMMSNISFLSTTLVSWMLLLGPGGRQSSNEEEGTELAYMAGADAEISTGAVF